MSRVARMHSGPAKLAMTSCHLPSRRGVDSVQTGVPSGLGLGQWYDLSASLVG